MKEAAVFVWVLALFFGNAPALAVLLAGLGLALVVVAYWP